MIINVTMNTTMGVYHLCSSNKLNKALAVAIMSAVINDNSRGETFLVSSTDMALN